MRKRHNIRYQRKAGKILREVFRTIVVCAGKTGLELNAEIEEIIRKMGGIPTNIGAYDFEYAACISVNDCVCHGNPPPEVFAVGDLVKVDVTCGVKDKNGTIWHADAARTYRVLGTRAVQVLPKHDYSIIRPGLSLGELGAYIQSVYKERGVTSVGGHFIGANIHISPFVPNYDNGDLTKLKIGDIICVEPIWTEGSPLLKKVGFDYNTLDGSKSYHHEDTILITRNGHEVLT